MPKMDGASLSGLTVTLAVSVVVLNAVVPPVVEASAPVVPETPPLVVSHARKVMPLAIAPSNPIVGTNRTRSLAVADNNTALLSATAPKAVQLLPPSVEYSQMPFVSSTPVTAMPSTAPASSSVIGAPPPLASTSATVSPAGSVVFCSTPLSARLPLLSRTGASFSGVTVMVKVPAAGTAPSSPPSAREKSKLSVAFSPPEWTYCTSLLSRFAWVKDAMALPGLVLSCRYPSAGAVVMV